MEMEGLGRGFPPATSTYHRKRSTRNDIHTAIFPVAEFWLVLMKTTTHQRPLT